MAGKAKVVDVYDAFGLVDTMSIGDVLGKKSKKNFRKSSDPPKDTGVKKARLTSAEEAASVAPITTPVISPDISGSQVQGKKRFYAEYVRLSDSLVHGQLW